MKQVAVIGAGNWGLNVVNAIYELGELAAVAEVSGDVRNRLRTMYPGMPVYESFEPVFASDIPAVAIATPAATHYRIARQALLAGKDVFVEKPITLSLHEAEDLRCLARENGRILMVGHLLLYQPTIRWIKQYLASGELGKVYSLHQQRSKLGRVRSVENVLWSLGVHDIAVLLHLAGEELPQRISVNGQRILQTKLEDDMYLHLSFRGGVQAHLHISWLWPEQERRLVVIGSKGMLVHQEQEQTVTLHRKGVCQDLTCWDEGSEVVFRGSAKPLTAECLHFLDCISNRQTPISGADHAVAVVQVMEECMRLLKEGTPV
ncbi:Gfo/Idh/MocA family protein [Brevibacillus sp. B_LB10_24]|uniref:Gfo/Idh/MocA family protein n=1 Tax=Brevibacillus sp. B_LB10_24 TaxID=3380645 RepID=UPI0038B9F250